MAETETVQGGVDVVYRVHKSAFISFPPFHHVKYATYYIEDGAVSDICWHNCAALSPPVAEN